MAENSRYQPRLFAGYNFNVEIELNNVRIRIKCVFRVQTMMIIMGVAWIWC